VAAHRAPSRFGLVEDTTLWRGHVFSLHTARFVDPDGEAFERDVVRHPGAVAVVAVDGAGMATLVRQYRGPVAAEILELPAGTCDRDGEDLEATARRELEEEAGIRAGRLRRLATVFNSPGYCDQQTTLFLATELSRTTPARAGTEERWMSVAHIALDDVVERVLSGEISDATTIVGLLLARHVLASSPPETSSSPEPSGS